MNGIYVKKNIYKGIDLIMQSSNKNYRDANFSLGFLYHQGKYLKRDIDQCLHLYKEASSFNNNYAKNNLGILHKNGFENQIKKNWANAEVYFKEAIKQKNDEVTKYNLSHIYIYEDVKDKFNESIQYLSESTEQGFEYSKSLLLIILFKKYGNDISNIMKELSKNIKNVDKYIDFIQD